MWEYPDGLLQPSDVESDSDGEDTLAECERMFNEYRAPADGPQLTAALNKVRGDCGDSSLMDQMERPGWTPSFQRTDIAGKLSNIQIELLLVLLLGSCILRCFWSYA